MMTPSHQALINRLPNKPQVRAAAALLAEDQLAALLADPEIAALLSDLTHRNSPKRFTAPEELEKRGLWLNPTAPAPKTAAQIVDARGNPLQVNGRGETKPARIKPRLRVRKMSEVKSEPLQWIWPGRVPSRRITVIMGRQGKGKSTLVCWLASAVSAGLPWPDSTVVNAPGSVIILQGEDIAEEDLRPRFEAMKADQGKIHLVDGIERNGRLSHFNLANDVGAFADFIDEIGDVKLVIIDPIAEYTGGINSRSDTEVRALMEPLKQLAQEKNLAIVLVMHPSKNMEADVMDRVANSGAYTQKARVWWYYSDDPKDRSRRLLSLMKGNPRGLTITALGSTMRGDRLVWRPIPVNLNADQVDHALRRLAREELLTGKQRNDSSVIHLAKDFILKYLEKGPAWVSIVLDQAELVSIRETSFRKALRRLTEDEGRVERFEGDGKRLSIRLAPAVPAPSPEAPPEPARNEPDPVSLDAWHDDGGSPGRPDVPIP